MTGYFRFGRLPVESAYEPWLRSRNHKDGCLEDGVSVYEGILDDGLLVLDFRDIDGLSGTIIAQAGDPVYEISGGRLIGKGEVDPWGARLCPHGSDGEPLLRGTASTLQARHVNVRTIAAIFTKGGEPRLIWEKGAGDES